MARFKIENRTDADWSVILNTEQDVAEWAVEHISECAYDDALDEEGWIYIGSLRYLPSEVLQRVDPIAYRCGYDDWLSGVTGDLVYELERMNVGDEATLFEVDTDLYVTCIEDEDEEEDE